MIGRSPGRAVCFHPGNGGGRAATSAGWRGSIAASPGCRVMPPCGRNYTRLASAEETTAAGGLALKTARQAARQAAESMRVPLCEAFGRGEQGAAAAGDAEGCAVAEIHCFALRGLHIGCGGGTTRRQIPSLCQQCKLQTHAMKTGWPGGIPRVVTLLIFGACCGGEWTCNASRAGNESPTLAHVTCSIASARDRVVKMCSTRQAAAFLAAARPDVCFPLHS